MNWRISGVTTLRGAVSVPSTSAKARENREGGQQCRGRFCRRAGGEHRDEGIPKRTRVLSRVCAILAFFSAGAVPAFQYEVESDLCLATRRTPNAMGLCAIDPPATTVWIASPTTSQRSVLTTSAASSQRSVLTEALQCSRLKPTNRGAASGRR